MTSDCLVTELSDNVARAQVARMSPAAVREHVAQLRERILGQRMADVVPLHRALQEMCELLKQDVADLQSKEAHYDSRQQADSRPVAGTEESQRLSRKTHAPAVLHSNGDAMRRTCEDDASADAALLIATSSPLELISDGAHTDELQTPADAAERTGAECCTLWGRKTDPVHPVYAAVVVACASHAWLQPAYLHELVLGVEQHMMELEAHMSV